MSISADTPNVGSQIFAVIIGGMFGAVSRFLLSHYLQNWTKPIPLAPLIVNATGSFLIGLTNALIARSGRPLGFVTDLVVTGLYGALTTWSTVIFDSFTMITADQTAPQQKTEPVIASGEGANTNGSAPMELTSTPTLSVPAAAAAAAAVAANAQFEENWYWSLSRRAWGFANVCIHIALCLALVWFGAAAGNSFHTSVVPL